VSLIFGRKYGLVGRNGTGKSTLLRAISAREIEVPTHLDILHVEQEVRRRILFLFFFLNFFLFICAGNFTNIRIESFF